MFLHVIGQTFMNISASHERVLRSRTAFHCRAQYACTRGPNIGSMS